MSKFTVEFGDERNGSQLIKTLDIRVRGHYSTSKLKRAHDVGRKMAGMPDIPGVCMEVDGARGKCRIFDPLSSNPNLLQQVNNVSDEAVSIRPSDKTIVAVPETEHELNDDHLKTLLYELHRKKESSCIRVVKGELPSIEKIEAMPGRQLTLSKNALHPRYKDEEQEWMRGLDRQTM